MISRNKNNHQRTYVHSWDSDSNLSLRPISQKYGRSWKKQQCPTSNALSIYASTSPEVQTPPMNRTIQKCMYGPIGHLRTGRNHPLFLDKRLENFSSKLDKLFKIRTGKPNLLPYQTRALQKLQQHQDFLICPCDKNLGPAIIERDNYIKIALRDHLLDGRTYYRPLSTADCANHKQRLENEIKDWMKKYHKNITKMERAFLKQGLKDNKKAFAGFYLTLKAHKLKPGQNVTHLKSRPIVACPGSLLHPLGIWTDRKLQALAKEQVSYFRNSYDLRQELCSKQYHPKAQLFKADAISMYTNIPTNTAIMLIARHI